MDILHVNRELEAIRETSNDTYVTNFLLSCCRHHTVGFFPLRVTLSLMS